MRYLFERVVDASIASHHLTEITTSWCPSDAGRGHWVCSDYFETEWRNSYAPKASLPIALNLEGLYSQLIRALMPYPAREGETLQVHADRISEIKTQERTCERLKSKVSKEKQFNRRVAFNQDLKADEMKLGELTG